MRVITFQSDEVLQILLTNEIYICDKNKCREQHDYEYEMNELGISNPPIWFFNNKEIITGLNADIIERWRCEMSLHQKPGLNNFLMFEFEIPESRLIQGKTHNIYKYAVVTDKLLLSEFCAVYKVCNSRKFKQSNPNSPFDWYFKEIRLINRYNNLIPSITDDCIDFYTE